MTTSMYRHSPDGPGSVAQRLEDLARVDEYSANMLQKQLDTAGRGLPDVDEGRHLPAEALAQLVQQKDTPEERIVIVLGAPRAGDLEAILGALHKTARVFLLERDPARALALFERFPIESHVESGRLVAAFGEEEAHISSRFFQMVNIQRSPEFEFLDPQTATAAEMSFYIDVLKKIRKAVRLDLFNVGTLVCRGPLWQHNTIVNLPHLISNPGIGRLRNILCGKPAVVVAAGPSLNESIQSLVQVRESFIVISTGTALRALQAAGIRPDLVVAVDASHLTAPQFETPCQDLYLACSSFVFPPVVRKFRGLFSGSLDASPIDRWIDSLTTSRGTLFAGGTVTSSAIDLAVGMGCNPVITIGLDLCFADDGTTHASHTMYDGRRLDPQSLLGVPGNCQEWVYTSNQFRCYIHFLEEYIERNPRTQFINANHGGARIHGMKVISPSGLGCFGAERFNAGDVIQRVHSSYTCPDGTPQKIRAELEDVADQLETVLNDMRRGAMLCNHLIMILRSPRPSDSDPIRQHLREMEEIDFRLAEARESSIFLKMSLWPASYRSGTQPAGHEMRYSAELLASKRSRELYEQIGGAARWTRDALRQVIEELPRPKKIIDERANQQSGERHLYEPQTV